MEAYKLLRTGLAHVPEGRRIFQQMTVQENLEMGAYTRKDVCAEKIWRRCSPVLPPSEGASQADGGHPFRRRAADAGHVPRSDEPARSCMMLDEPSMGLAPILVEQIFDIIKELHTAGTTILLVEQNARKALSDCRPCLRSGNRQHHLKRHRRGACQLRRGEEGLPRRLKIGHPLHRIGRGCFYVPEKPPAWVLLPVLRTGADRGALCFQLVRLLLRRNRASGARFLRLCEEDDIRLS